MEDFIYTTGYYHPDNTVTMNDYLENHLPDNLTLIYQDGSYAEITNGNEIFEIHASGNGDSYNHRITFKLRAD